MTTPDNMYEDLNEIIFYLLSTGSGKEIKNLNLIHQPYLIKLFGEISRLCWLWGFGWEM